MLCWGSTSAAPRTAKSLVLLRFHAVASAVGTPFPSRCGEGSPGRSGPSGPVPPGWRHSWGRGSAPSSNSPAGTPSRTSSRALQGRAATYPKLAARPGQPPPAGRMRSPCPSSSAGSVKTGPPSRQAASRKRSLVVIFS